MSICVYMNNWTRMFMAALFITFPKLEILHRYINEEDNKKNLWHIQTVEDYAE